MIFASSATSAQLRRTHFYGEDVFAKQVPFFKALIDGLRRDKNFDACYEVGKDRAEVTKIDPNGDGRPEFLVKVACGNSSTSYLFWLVSYSRGSYEPIFSVGSMGIDFGKRNRKGYPAITANGCNGNTCFYEYFTFDGNRYVQKRTWTRPNTD